MKKQTRSRKRTAVLTILCLLCVFLFGCGSSEKAAVYTAAETAAVTAADAGGAENGWYDSAPLEEAVEEAEENMKAEKGIEEHPETESSPLTSKRKLIRTIDMNIETDDFNALLQQVRSQVDSLGGYIEQSDVSGQRTTYQGNPIPRSAYFSIRIPSEKLSSFTTSVEANANVTNKSETTRDVTLQYSDIESKKKSLTIEQDRLWALLEQADSLESILALEERLSEIRYELENLESRLRLYDNQVDYSTINLYVEEVTVYTPTEPETIGERIVNGFTNSLHEVSELSISLLIGLLTASPFWVPSALLLFLLHILYKKHSWKKQIKQEAMKQTEHTDSK